MNSWSVVLSYVASSTVIPKDNVTSHLCNLWIEYGHHGPAAAKVAAETLQKCGEELFRVDVASDIRRSAEIESGHAIKRAGEKAEKRAAKGTTEHIQHAKAIRTNESENAETQSVLVAAVEVPKETTKDN
eukprot:PhF_6_TR646/c1_g1_i3/m.908